MNNEIKGKVFFYIRVSTKQQNEQLQLDAMNKFIEDNGIEDPKVYIDKQTGTNTDRPEFQAMLKAIGKGDLLVIWALDRLSRNYNDCKRLWSELTNRGVDIHVITMPILDTRQYKDTLGNFINDLIVTILGYVAEQETNARRERATAGYKSMKTSPKFVTMAYKDKDGNIVEAHSKKVSKKTGNVVGRPVLDYPKNFASVVEQQQKKEMTMQQALAALGIKKSSYYKLIKKYEQENSVSLLKK